MSGHNKWSQIKHQKGKTDAQKSRAFSKLGKLITDEAKKAKGNREAPGLKSAIEKAKAANMPADTIDRAITKATTDNSGAMDSILYEAYGPGGCAMIIDILTTNRNKAAQEIKHILAGHGISLAAIGSASWAFKKSHDGWTAETTVPLSETDIAELEKIVEELETQEDVQDIFTNAE